MSKEGLLVTKTYDGNVVQPSNNMDELFASTELIYEELKHSGESTNTVNGEIFIKWCENRLFPTFQKLFPGKQVNRSTINNNPT